MFCRILKGPSTVKDLAPSIDLILGGGRGACLLVEVQSHAAEDTTCVVVSCGSQHFTAMQLQPVRKAAGEESVE